MASPSSQSATVAASEVPTAQDPPSLDEAVSFKEANNDMLTRSFGHIFSVILRADNRSLTKKHFFLARGPKFVAINGFGFDARAYQLKMFDCVFKDGHFLIRERQRWVPIRNVTRPLCGILRRPLMCVCYQVRHHMWIPLWPVGSPDVLRGRIALNRYLIPCMSPATKDTRRVYRKCCRIGTEQ
eukprot:GILJ01004138.1.p1 GENE.GILJ01004138.1~~GILJ01004138.1.p1  ORF type:complete len:184 (-),score=12.94 GILJ01004138.1:1566-2117(-)